MQRSRPVDQVQLDDTVAGMGRFASGAVDVGREDAGDALCVVRSEGLERQTFGEQCGRHVAQPRAAPHGRLLGVVVDVDHARQPIERDRHAIGHESVVERVARPDDAHGRRAADEFLDFGHRRRLVEVGAVPTIARPVAVFVAVQPSLERQMAATAEHVAGRVDDGAAGGDHEARVTNSWRRASITLRTPRCTRRPHDDHCRRMIRPLPADFDRGSASGVDPADAR